MRLFDVPLLRFHRHCHSCAALCAAIAVAIRRVDISRHWTLIEGLLACHKLWMLGTVLDSTIGLLLLHLGKQFDRAVTASSESLTAELKCLFLLALDVVLLFEKARLSELLLVKLHLSYTSTVVAIPDYKEIFLRLRLL